MQGLGFSLRLSSASGVPLGVTLAESSELQP